ncbi:MAG TPA: hypothetical protein GXZ85_01180 [Firmicutes bacterium]|nr:hypothetical protein [Bacillota bacterium]
MVIKLRLETPADYRAVEELTREAFWVTTDCRPYGSGAFRRCFAGN